MVSKDSTCIFGTFAFSDRAHPGPWPLACTVTARPAHFFALLPFICIYNQHTQQFAGRFGDSHVTHTPTRTVRNVRCRIVYERSQQIRTLNNETGLATNPKGLGGLVIPQGWWKSR